MTTRTTRRAVCPRRAPGVRKTRQRQSNNKWRDALTWLLICEHLIAVICLAMFTSRQVKCGILVSCSRVEHSVGLTTAVKKVPGVNASVDWAKLPGCFAALSSASTLNVYPLSRIRCQTWNCIPAADLIFGGAALHPRPWSREHARRAAIFTVIDWTFWPVNIGSPIFMFYCTIDDCVTLFPSVTNSHHPGDQNPFKSLYPNGWAIVPLSRLLPK